MIDDTPPVVNWPADVNLTCLDCNIDPANTGEPSATDECGTITASYDDVITGDCPKRVERTWTVSDGCNEVSQVQIIQCLPRSEVVVTDSSLCTYDMDPTDECDSTFRLLFTQDPKNWPYYKVTASNPGQTYYNMFYNGTLGASVTFTVTLPYPYVTQGAQPIHVYDTVNIFPQPDGQTCYEPDGGFYVDSTQVTNTDYDSQAIGSYTMFEVTLTVPDTGFIYLNTHLDYGLKGSSPYTANNNTFDALDSTGVDVLIPNHGSYEFSVDDSTGGASADSLCNVNVFKKLPGAGGFAGIPYVTSDGIVGMKPMAGCIAVLQDSKGAVLATGETDEDGWYFCEYKWKGKPATVYITLTPPGGKPITKSSFLKGNGYTEVNFDVP